MKQLSISLFTVLFLAGMVYAQDHTAEVNQSGDDNQATVDQSAIGYEALINQSGTSLTASILQFDASDSGNMTGSSATINQSGSDHDAEIEQQGYGDEATINQSGEGLGNYAGIIQNTTSSMGESGQASASVTIDQQGQQNQAFVEQIGGKWNTGEELNVSGVTQIGTGNYVDIFQNNNTPDGVGQNASVYQEGNDNVAEIYQDSEGVLDASRSNTTEVSQLGDNGEALISQSGVGGHIELTQYANDFADIAQTSSDGSGGDGNVVRLEQDGGSSANISQSYAPSNPADWGKNRLSGIGDEFSAATQTNGAQLNLTQEGSGNWLQLEQDGGIANVTQSGHGNQAIISQEP